MIVTYLFTNLDVEEMTEANLNPSPNTVISSIILNNILPSAAFTYTRVAQKIKNKFILNMLSPRNQQNAFSFNYFFFHVTMLSPIV